MHYIDYSQYRLWHFCPRAWHCRYCLGLRRKSTGLKDDALTLGSLFHDGMEEWYLHKSPRINPSTIAKLTPTKECLDLAQQLVLGYSQHYPQDPWTTKAVEEAVVRPLSKELSLVAKVDQTALIEQPLVIDSGHPGITFMLEPGIYSIENKTKAQNKPFAGYLSSWQANMQASFQLLALQHKYGEKDVKGVVVNVAEKPTVQRPRRMCKKCKESSFLSEWLIDGDNPDNNKCPQCLNSQKLKAYEPRKKHDPRYYRIVVTRDSERLEKDLRKIESVGRDMLKLKSGGVQLELYENDENCINPMNMRSKCDFFESHVNMVPIDRLVGDTLEQIEDPYEYIGLNNENE
jgi:hypothetical protein